MNAQPRTILIIGDLIALILVTIWGFATHGELGTAGTRMLTTFVPLSIAWAAVAPFLGLYDPSRAKDLRQIWRVLWAGVLAGPLAAWLRGVWLNAPIIPIFVLVLGGVGAVGILIWRLLYVFFARRSAGNLKS
jgi:hypothetical protein